LQSGTVLALRRKGRRTMPASAATAHASTPPAARVIFAGAGSITTAILSSHMDVKVGRIITTCKSLYYYMFSSASQYAYHVRMLFFLCVSMYAPSDIDECELRKQNPSLRDKYPCSSDGVCKNRLGGYDCPCKAGMKGDGKAGTCTEKFPLAAKVVVGNKNSHICSNIIVLLVFVYLFIHSLSKNIRSSIEGIFGHKFICTKKILAIDIIYLCMV
jgi:hypothetical protein